MLPEDNARQGFFEHEDFEAFVQHLPEPVNDIARFAYVTGWRRGEVVPLKWEDVDRTAREVRLRTSKNGEGRLLPLDDELWGLIERRWAARKVKREDGTEETSAHVFHRAGRPVVDFRKAWETALEESKVPAKLFHDLRRTAVRNMVRAGVPQSVAMAISGHKTESMFQRYNVTSGADRIEALRKTRAHLAAKPHKAAETVIESATASA
jgi:integrase